MATVPSTLEPVPISRPGTGGRLAGLDVARALAFAGMLLAHFAWSRQPGDPGWLAALDGAADGRAAPLFCVLLGVGSGLLVARGTRDIVLVRRGLALFALGLLLWPQVGLVYLVLPHYGLLLALIPLLRRVPTRWMLPLAGVAFLVPAAVAAVLDDHALRGSPQPSSYGDLLDVGELARNLLWTGGYPLVGWVGFALVGLWLSRQQLGDRAVQGRLFAGGVLVMALQPLLALIAVQLGGIADRRGAGGLSGFFDGVAHSNRTAWYVLASATAVAVIAACLLATNLFDGPGWTPLIRLGQLALTVYVAHLLLGRYLVWDWLARARPPLTHEVGLVAAVFVAFAACAVLWRCRWRRGPMEAALRAVSR